MFLSWLDLRLRPHLLSIAPVDDVSLGERRPFAHLVGLGSS